jgi:GPR1/FUN34/yaaH family
VDLFSLRDRFRYCLLVSQITLPATFSHSWSSMPNLAIRLISSGAMAVFWLSFAILFVPSFGIIASYSATGDFNDGLLDPGFNADLGIYLVCWGLAVFVILVCSIKTNITFVILFTILDAGFFIFSASHFQTAAGNPGTAAILTKVNPPTFESREVDGY